MSENRTGAGKGPDTDGSSEARDESEQAGASSLSNNGGDKKEDDLAGKSQADLTADDLKGDARSERQ
jgi:hypothetical protein